MSHRIAPRLTAALACLACSAVVAGATSVPAAAGPAPSTAVAGVRALVDARLAGERSGRARVAPPTKVIVKYRAGVSAAAVRGSQRAVAVRPLRALPLVGAQLVAVPAGSTAQATAARLDRDPAVEYAVPDVRRTANAFAADALAASLWGLDNQGQLLGDHPGVANVDVDAPQAWTRTKGSRSVAVAVIDTGVAHDHPDLRSSAWVNPGEVAGNGLDDDGNGYADDVHGWDFFHDDATTFDAGDGDLHGTHVAGTIAAAAGNGVGVAGVAPGVSIMSLKVLGPEGGSDSDIVDALAYAARNGADVVNMSLGSTAYDDPGAANPVLREAIEASGLTVVASAGNDGSDNDDPRYASYPASFPSPNIVSVAAVDHRGRLAPFSSYGRRSVDVGAPGVSVLSTVPRQRGLAAATASRYGRGRAQVWGFGLEDVAPATARADLLSRALTQLGATTRTPILLVQDDEHDLAPLVHGTYFRNAGALYRSALAAKGYRDVAVTSVRSGAAGPTAAQMTGRLVLWETGQGFGAATTPAYLSTLQPRDLDALTEHVAGGGRLLLAGAEALYTADGAVQAKLSSFTRGVLQVAMVGEGALQTRVQGTGGVGISGGWDMSPQSAPWRDTFSPVRGSTAGVLLAYPEVDYAYLDGTSMAAPHVSGIAALAASARPGERGTALAQRVIRSTRVLWPLAGRTVTGGLASADLATR